MDTIRDVVVRISLEQVQAALQTPNVDPIIQAEKAVSRIVEQEQERQKAVTLATSSARLSAAQQFAAEMQALHQAETQQATSLIQMEQGQRRRAADAAQQMAAQEEARLARVRGAYGDALSGVIQLTKGIVLATTDTSAGYGALIERLRGVEAVAQTWGGLRSEILSVGGALLRIAGPGGLAVGALAAAGAGIGYVLHKANVFKMPGELDEEFRGRDQVAELDERRRRETEDVNARVNGGFDAKGRAVMGYSDRYALGAEQRAMMPDAERMQAVNRALSDVNDERNQAHGFADDKALAQQRLVLAETDLKLQREREQIIGRQTQDLKGQLAAVNQQIDAAKRLVEAEKSRVDAVKGAVGRLNPLEREEGRALAKKIGDGTATDEDLKRAEQIPGLAGLAGKKIDSAFAAKGGADADEFNRLLGNDPLEGKGSALQDAQGKLNFQQQGRDDLVSALQEANKLDREIHAAVLAALSEARDAKLRFENMLRGMKQNRAQGA